MMNIPERNQGASATFKHRTLQASELFQNSEVFVRLAPERLVLPAPITLAVAPASALSQTAILVLLYATLTPGVVSACPAASVMMIEAKTILVKSLSEMARSPQSSSY